MKKISFIALLLAYLCLAFDTKGQDSLQVNAENWQQNKNIPQQHADQWLAALSHYPTLEQTKIRFKPCKIKTTLNARPTLFSTFFVKPNKRKYVIRYNVSSKGQIPLSLVNEKALMGLMGHELAHLVDYQKRNCWQVLGRGTDYLSKRRKAAFEKEIDMLAIKHGFGEHLYTWSDFVLNHSCANDSYKAFKKDTYLTPKQIKQIADILPLHFYPKTL